MTDGSQRDTSKAGPDPLGAVVRRTRAGMVVETALRAFWPLASFLAAFWAAIAFGLSEVLSRGQLVFALALAAGASVYFLVIGIRAFIWPSLDDARARVDATLPGRPLAALRDTAALGAEDPGARAVWAGHLERMRRAALGARPVGPEPRLATRDPFALRLAALVALIAAAIFARGEGLVGVPAALAPGGGSAMATGPSFEGWAEPPAYTGRPTLYLPEVSADRPVSVPAGTRITLRAYGDVSRFALTQDVADVGLVPAGAPAPEGPPAPPKPPALAEVAPGIAIAEFAVTRDGAVALTQRGRALGEWQFVMEPDQPPTIALSAPVERAPTGETRLGYVATDDYGVTAARAEMTLDLARVDRRYGLAVDPAARPPLTVDLPLPMRGAGPEVNETLVEDFSKNPWAGLPVTLTLTAEDGLGQVGASGPIPTVLPGRRFYDPLAAALIEQRRDLLWSPANAERVTRVLRAVTYRPEDLFDDMRAYLVTRVAIRELAGAVETGAAPAVIDDVAEALWQAALQIEDGVLGDARARLERAKERLSEALRNDASDEEIARLMDELRQATQDYMQQMAREAIERGDQQQAEASPPGQTMTQDQIQELMDRIQELSEQGRKAEAEQLLSMLQQLLENMQMRMGQSGESQGQGQGQQTMQGLADTLREQQGLADDSFDQLQREFRENMNRDFGQGEGQGEGEAEGQPDPRELARRQEALRDLMEGMRRNLPGNAGEAAREALREAERNMGEARDRLEKGDTSGALDRQANAIDQLREGMRELAEDNRRAEGGQSGAGEREGADRAEGSRDPLGRPLGANGGVGTDQRMVPGADSAARARGLLDEIRRRAGELSRPPLELDYLRRLLDQF